MVDLDNVAVENATETTASDVAEYAEAGSMFSWGEIELTLIIFIFGLIAVGVFYFLAQNKQVTPHLMRLYVIIILVFGSLLVVSSGYATAQIAPVIGFFGTIAGYLLGRSEKRDGERPE